ncbi:nucleoside-diphosphate sugar epimerase/dehydratase [Anaeromusa acidaminophila]|uniref:polysaccharide biosynthesis protein n=1 Tax=Anaeromusa acidaminophila TaxID=81464 RepID=UPI000584D30B
MILLIVCDAAIVAATPWLGFSLRFEDGLIPMVFSRNYELVVGAVVGINIVCCYFLGLYRILWQYASIHELIVIVCAVSIGSLLSVAYSFFADCTLPRSVYIISWILNIGGIGVSRLFLRVYYYFRIRAQRKKAETSVLIIGAGDAGAVIARELKGQVTEAKRLVGFLDDSDFKKKQSLFGVPVLGGTKDLLQVVVANEIDEIIIAMPSVGGKKIREISQKCKETNCRVRIVPGIYELIDGQVSLKQVRDLNLEDLLRREPVELEQTEISGYLTDKRVLVTGAGGSIGSELCRQIMVFQPRELILLGRGENSIYETHLALKADFPDGVFRTVIADVRDEGRMNEVFSQIHPQVIFHAAAHKHVPLMELQPNEAIRNNIFGTYSVARTAMKYNVERFILISTDKAVNPTSVMGATKRVAELIICYFNGLADNTTYAAVRFGNVLGSRGSVVPLFQRQIKQGGPLTITHPDMSRYFMTIPEAAQLVLQAGSQSTGGEVFVLDMGEPVNILDMAKDLIELSGLKPYEDISIEFCGLRPGEKMFEELLTAEEGTKATCHAKVFIANIRSIEGEILKDALKKLSVCNSLKEVFEILHELVPAYKCHVKT